MRRRKTLARENLVHPFGQVLQSGGVFGLVAGLLGSIVGPPIGPDVWGDTRLALPKEFSNSRLLNILTGELLDSSADQDAGPQLAAAYRRVLGA